MPSGVAHGEALVAFVEAVIGGEAGAITSSRKAVHASLGGAALVDTAATLASFNAVVKIADGTGIPLESWKEARTVDLRRDLAIDALKR